MSVKENFENLWKSLGEGNGSLGEAVIGQVIDGKMHRFFLLDAGLTLDELANRVSSFTYMNDKNGQHDGKLILTLPNSYQEQFKSQEHGFFELCDLAGSYDPENVAHGLCVKFMGAGAPSYDKPCGMSLVKYLEACGLHVA